MSNLRVNTITSENDLAVTFPKGVSILNSITGNVNVSGICTAGSFYGNGSNITNLPGISLGKTIGTTIII